MSTTAALVARIRVLAVQSGSRAKHSDAEIISAALNPSARRIASDCLSYTKFETIQTQIGISDYTLPVDLAPFLRAASVTFGTRRRPLAYVLYEQLAAIPPSAMGIPQMWTIFGDKFCVRPFPSSVDNIYIDAFGSAVPCSEVTPAVQVDELGFLSDAEDAVCFDAADTICSITNQGSRQNTFEKKAQAAMYRVKRRLISGQESWPQVFSGVEALFY